MHMVPHWPAEQLMIDIGHVSGTQTVPALETRKRYNYYYYCQAPLTLFQLTQACG